MNDRGMWLERKQASWHRAVWVWQVLHSGEGTVHVVKWRTSLIAWANDAGVKIYDTASYQRITFIERVPHSSLLRPQLVWQVYLFLFPPLFCLSFLGHKSVYYNPRLGYIYGPEGKSCIHESGWHSPDHRMGRLYQDRSCEDKRMGWDERDAGARGQICWDIVSVPDRLLCIWACSIWWCPCGTGLPSWQGGWANWFRARFSIPKTGNSAVNFTMKIQLWGVVWSSWF